MYQLKTFVKKEFKHILRDGKTLFILLGLPICLILIFGFALSNQVKNAQMVISDHAQDSYSKQLSAKIAASTYFKLSYAGLNTTQMQALFRKNKVKMVLVFPPRFGQDLLHSHSATLQVIMGDTDPNIASTLYNYLLAIVGDFEQQQQRPGAGNQYRINLNQRTLYNPQLLDAANFVPGVMALVLMLVSVMMTSVTMVKEKESGTLQLLLISPLKPVSLILAKAVPYFVLSTISVLVVLLMSYFLLDLPVKGSILLLLAVSMLFIASSLGIGIYISIISSSQQVAMLVSFMGMLIPTIMLSGFLFPIENMPYLLQLLARAIPAKWYYDMVQSIMIKGLGIHDVWHPILVLTGILLFFLTLSIKTFKTHVA